MHRPTTCGTRGRRRDSLQEAPPKPAERASHVPRIAPETDAAELAEQEHPAAMEEHLGVMAAATEDLPADEDLLAGLACRTPMTRGQI